jgi:hypothetical protein
MARTVQSGWEGLAVGVSALCARVLRSDCLPPL